MAKVWFMLLLIPYGSKYLFYSKHLHLLAYVLGKRINNKHQRNMTEVVSHRKAAKNRQITVQNYQLIYLYFYLRWTTFQTFVSFPGRKIQVQLSIWNRFFLHTWHFTRLRSVELFSKLLMELCKVRFLECEGAKLFGGKYQLLLFPKAVLMRVSVSPEKGKHIFDPTNRTLVYWNTSLELIIMGWTDVCPHSGHHHIGHGKYVPQQNSLPVLHR